MHVCLYVHISPLFFYKDTSHSIRAHANDLFLTLKTLFINKVLFCHYELLSVRTPALFGKGAGGQGEYWGHNSANTYLLIIQFGGFPLFLMLSAILDTAGPLPISETCPPLTSASPVSQFSFRPALISSHPWACFFYLLLNCCCFPESYFWLTVLVDVMHSQGFH